MTLRRDSHNPPSSSVRGRHIKISVAIQSNALGSAKPAKENIHIAALRDAVDAVKAGSRRPGNVQIAAGMKRQVIRGYGRLKRGDYKNLAARAYFENRPTAGRHG